MLDRLGRSHALPAARTATSPLVIAALGIVFGDIGTSPLYAFREALAGEGAAVVTRSQVIGIASLIVWSLLLVITVKYLFVVMRADLRGEGGVLALTALITGRGTTRADQDRRGGPSTFVLAMMGLFGTALLYGDGAITPAISVLSAVEGLEVLTVALEPAVIPIAIVILVALFAVQFRGTASLGFVFGRVMLVWFATLGVLGAASIVRHPGVLAAFNPAYAVTYLLDGGSTAFLSLGAIFLVVTGGEAMYADMGHFGRRPIAIGWLSLVMPALMLSYLGQAALLLADPGAARNPFYLQAPGVLRLPLVLLATAATVIASQALISGVFSLSMQAVSLGYLPRLRVIHTSEEERGQVYVPALNAALLVAAVALVIGFGSSSNLAAAYGVAVTMTMFITTVMVAAVAHRRWGWSWPKVLAMAAAFAVVDLAFLGANLFKIADGGWLPLLLGAVVFTIFTTWRRGRELLRRRTRDGTLSIDDFLDDLDPDELSRTPSEAVYLYSRPGKVPPALLATIRHFNALPERTVIVTVTMEDRPHVPPASRLRRRSYGEGIETVEVRVGYRDAVSVPKALAATVGKPGGIDTRNATYVLGRESVLATDLPGMVRWRERLFGLLLRNSTDPVVYFDLPPDRVTTVGRTVPI